MKEKVARFLALLVLVFSGASGLLNAVAQFGDETTAVQTSVTAGVLLYGILGLIAAAGMIARRSWTTAAVIAWGVSITYVATVAPRAFGGPDVPLVAGLMSGAVTAAIAFGVAWAARVASQPRSA